VIFLRLKPSIRVWIPAHRHQLLGGEGEIGVNRLRQMTDLSRNFAQLPVPLVASGDGNGSCLRIAETGNNIEQCALPRTIDTQQCKELAFAGAEGDGIKHGPADIREADAFNLEQTAQFEPSIPWTKSKRRCAAIGVRGPGTTSELVVPA